MAEAARDDLSRCHVCLGNYNLAANLPRILPCHHSICEECGRKEIGNEMLKCPVCRKKHRATQGIRSFSQNPYIVAMIEKQLSRPVEIKKCEIHDKELSLFCNQLDCKQPICLTCFLDSHRPHDVVEMEVLEAKENVFKEIESLKQKLIDRDRDLNKLKEDIKDETRACVDTLEHERVKVEQKGKESENGINQEIVFNR